MKQRSCFDYVGRKNESIQCDQDWIGRLAVRQEIENKWKKEFSLEFSYDRKSMSTYCVPLKASKLGNELKLMCNDAPDALDRYTHARVGSAKVPLTTTQEPQSRFTCQYGTDRDTLHCLALATSDTPMNPENMDLNDSTKFYT